MLRGQAAVPSPQPEQCGLPAGLSGCFQMPPLSQCEVVALSHTEHLKGSLSNKGTECFILFKLSTFKYQ